MLSSSLCLLTCALLAGTVRAQCNSGCDSLTPDAYQDEGGVDPNDGTLLGVPIAACGCAVGEQLALRVRIPMGKTVDIAT